MLVLNFTHPLDEDAKAKIEALASASISEVRAIPVQISQEEPLVSQVITIIESVGLSPEEWQMQPLTINLPGYAPVASVLLAELHGRMGHFPTIIRLRPQYGATTTYEVSELINLQNIRETARTQR